MPDHYATLGVAPNASRTAIRAAYLELMRRYHPDRNPSAAAATRVRAITAAYAVLRGSAQRAAYDEQLAQGRQARMASAMSQGGASQPPRWFPLALAAATIPLLAWALLPSTVPQTRSSERPTSIGTRAALAPKIESSTAPPVNAAASCSSPAVAGPIKRELFRRAARIRGSDAAAFARIAEYSQIRLVSMTPPVASGRSTAVQCDAVVLLDLPAGVVAASEYNRLTGNIRFTLQTAAAGGGSIAGFTTEPPLIALLTSLGRTQATATEPVDAAPVVHVVPQSEAARVPEWAPPPAPTPPLVRPAAAPAAPRRVEQQRPVAQQQPSFSCSAARTWAENSVCRSASLAALDRQLASLYGDAMQRADRTQQQQLARTDRLFLTRRDGCKSDGCVQSAYAAQIGQIHGIMAGPHPR